MTDRVRVAAPLARESGVTHTPLVRGRTACMIEHVGIP